MVKIVVVFVIAVVLLIIAYGLKSTHKNDSLQTDDYKQTFATIDRVIFSDTGNAKYYVSFSENGTKITAQTDHYSSKTRSLDTGDEVKIGYFFTKKGAPRAVILDERVIPVSNASSGFYKLLIIVGALLLLVAVAMFAKSIFSKVVHPLP